MFFVRQCNDTDIKEAIGVRRVELSLLLPTVSCPVPGGVSFTAVCSTYKRVLHAASGCACPTPVCAAIHAASVFVLQQLVLPLNVSVKQTVLPGRIFPIAACAVIGLYSTLAASTNNLASSTS
jgi:hypothetical protein